MKSLSLLLSYIVFIFILCDICNAQTTYFSKATGDLDIPGTWGTASDGSGSSPSDFLSSGDVFKIRNRTIVTHSSGYFWSLGTSVNVQIGDSINPIEFVFQSGDIIFDGIWSLTPNSTLTINGNINTNFSGTLNNLNINSTVNYNFANCSILIPLTLQYGNLVIHDNATLSNTISPISLTTRTLNILTNKLLTIPANHTLIISQNIVGSGSVSATNGNINFSTSSTGNRGSLFTLGTIGSFSLTTPPTGFLVLGSDLEVTGNFASFSTAGLDLNGNDLTLNGNIIFPTNTSNSIRGSSSSAIIIKGLGTITNSLTLNSTSNTIKVLGIDRTSVTINLANTLNITDSLSVLAGSFNTGGFLTLKSTSILKGRIGRVGGSISGNVTVETFIPGGTTGWAALGVPGVNGQTVLDWDTYVSSGGTTGVPMTCVGCAYDPTVTGTGSSSFVSIQDWNEPGLSYTKLTSASTLSVGTGHWVYVGDGFSTTNDLKLVNTGSANFGTGSIPISKTTATVSTDNGFNLITNPYASPISWNKFRNFGGNISDVAATIYGWNADVGGGGSSSFNGTISNPAAATSITNIIPSGQAFYVEALNVGNATLDYDEIIKTNDNTGSNPLQKSAANTDFGLLRLKFKGLYDWDETAFMIHKDASSLFDLDFDARKLFHSPGYVGYPGAYTKYTTISSKDADKQDYSINSLPPLTQSISIPILARVSTSGVYTISAFDFQNFDVCVGLIDKLDNSYHDLRLAPYSFTISDTTSAPRFELILCKDESLNAVGISEKNDENSSILISQNEQGAFVKMSFEKNTKANISVYNVIGQKLMRDISVEGTVTNTPLPIDLHNQVVLIKVTTDKESVTKKVVMH